METIERQSGIIGLDLSYPEPGNRSENIPNVLAVFHLGIQQDIVPVSSLIIAPHLIVPPHLRQGIKWGITITDGSRCLARDNILAPWIKIFACIQLKLGELVYASQPLRVK